MAKNARIALSIFGVAFGLVAVTWILAPLAGSLCLSRYSLEASSMMPAFPKGTHIWACKADGTEVDRGDVVVFLRPEKGEWAKRIVGVPGDTIQMVEGSLVINGTATPTRQLDDFLADDGGSLPQFEETLPNGATYRILNAGNEGLWESTDPTTIPDGHYYVLGDNRDHSIDSRKFGSVPSSSITAMIPR